MEDLIGKRVKLISMDDPQPIEVGSEGEICHTGFGVLTVKWDNGRMLGLIVGEDKYEIL